MPEPESTLYRDLVDAGADLDHHESDLYVVVTPESTAIISRYRSDRDMPRTFVSNVGGQLNYDIPFAYAPFWEAKAKHYAGTVDAGRSELCECGRKWDDCKTRDEAEGNHGDR